MRQAIKREPLLADAYLAHGPDPLLDPKLGRHLHHVLRDEAKRFVLDAEAARYFAHLCRDAPLALIDHMPFAVPPYEKMWVEFPFFEFFTITSGGLIPDPDGDSRVGYLYDGPRVYCLAAGKRTVDRRPSLPYSTGVLPIRYRLNQPLTVQEEAHLASMGMDRMKLDLFLWGSGSGAICGADQGDTVEADKLTPLQRHQLAALRSQHGMEHILTDPSREAELWPHFYARSAGDLRNIVGLLVYLNQTSGLRYEAEIPAAPRMIGNRTGLLLRHTVIKLHLNPVPRIIANAKGRRAPGFKRLHDVRGHWCHDAAARADDCTHQWSEMDYHHYRCLLCGGQKWHRKEHQRGKRDVGRVKQVYEVTE